MKGLGFLGSGDFGSGFTCNPKPYRIVGYDPLNRGYTP